MRRAPILGCGRRDDDIVRFPGRGLGDLSAAAFNFRDYEVAGAHSHGAGEDNARAFKRDLGCISDRFIELSCASNVRNPGVYVAVANQEGDPGANLFRFLFCEDFVCQGCLERTPQIAKHHGRRQHHAIVETR